MTPYEKTLMKSFEVPLPAKEATHAYLFTKDKKKATVPLKDFDTLVGSAGKITYGRYVRTGWMAVGKAYKWDGKKAI
jgi:hypothetical protein